MRFGGRGDSLCEENTVSDFGSKLEELTQKKWTLFAARETLISEHFLLSILGRHAQNNTVVGRFGCIPNHFYQNSWNFHNCHPHPVFKSAFAVSNDLLPKLRLVNENSTEYDFGHFLRGADFVDDFHFHYFGAEHKTRGESFSASFWPAPPSSIPHKFSHALGIPVDVMLTPKAKGKFMLGIGYRFYQSTIPDQGIISIECSNKTNIEMPPQYYTRKSSVKVNCFGQ